MLSLLVGFTETLYVARRSSISAGFSRSYPTLYRLECQNLKGSRVEIDGTASTTDDAIERLDGVFDGAEQRSNEAD